MCSNVAFFRSVGHDLGSTRLAVYRTHDTVLTDFVLKITSNNLFLSSLPNIQVITVVEILTSLRCGSTVNHVGIETRLRERRSRALYRAMSSGFALFCQEELHNAEGKRKRDARSSPEENTGAIPAIGFGGERGHQRLLRHRDENIETRDSNVFSQIQLYR